MKRALSSIVVLIFGAVLFVSCGSSSKKATASGFGFRAFVSNPLQPIGGGVFQVFNIVDAAKDSNTGLYVNLSGSSTYPGLMVVTPNLKNTLVFSSSGNTVAVVDNAGESIAQGGNGPFPAIPLLGPTESILPWIDSQTAFAAIPGATVTGHPAGAVEVLSFLSGSTSPRAVIPVKSARYLVQSHSGNRILVFSDDPQNAQDSPPECPTSQCITMLSPNQIGAGEPRTAIVSSAFDHPVWGVFSADDSTAYIFNCGPECGGSAASISVLDLTQNPPAVSSTISVPASTYGLLSGATLYVAGTPSSVPCPTGVVDTFCGELTTIDTGSLTITGSFTISEGFHARMVMTPNGQLFVGANSSRSPCSNCLTIFNTGNSSVVFGTDEGDVTDIEPITDRNVVYVCQSGRLRIYDTTTDALQTRQVNIVGQANNVKLVDPPGNFN